MIDFVIDIGFEIWGIFEDLIIRVLDRQFWSLRRSFKWKIKI